MFRYTRNLLITFALLLASPASPQTRGISGKPYTATRKTLSVQTLPDGTTITRTSSEKEARDSQGRTFHGTSLPSNVAQHEFFNVMDPVAQETINWTSGSKQATIFHFAGSHTVNQPPTNTATSPSGTVEASLSGGIGSGIAGTAILTGGVMGGLAMDQQDPALRPQHHREDLPATTIAGIYATGTRTTTTYPTGSLGNDRPIVTTQEVWTSPDLHITLRTVVSDPRSGTRTNELIDLNQTEPDPSLFRVPEGYTVKDQNPPPAN